MDSPDTFSVLTAAECAARTGLTARALRLYEEHGLICPRRMARRNSSASTRSRYSRLLASVWPRSAASWVLVRMGQICSKCSQFSSRTGGRVALTQSVVNASSKPHLLA
ncbi:MAG: MerR family transcriptional regulator [Steroidobacteraceae bacterium]